MGFLGASLRQWLGERFGGHLRLLRPTDAASVHKDEREYAQEFRRALLDAEADRPNNRLGDEARYWHELSTGLCLSGGGIRSASFAIGFLHALAERRMLAYFDYLSAVSGGGYAAAWWSALLARTRSASEIRTYPDAIKAVAEAERRISDNVATPKPIAALPTEPPDRAHESLRDAFERRYVRAHGNYLTARTGLFSTDTWATALTIVRNLIYGLAGLGALLVASAWAITEVSHLLVPHTRAHAEWLMLLALIALAAGWFFTSRCNWIDLPGETADVGPPAPRPELRRPPPSLSAFLLASGATLAAGALLFLSSHPSAQMKTFSILDRDADVTLVEALASGMGSASMPGWTAMGIIGFLLAICATLFVARWVRQSLPLALRAPLTLVALLAVVSLALCLAWKLQWSLVVQFLAATWLAMSVLYELARIESLHRLDASERRTRHRLLSRESVPNTSALVVGILAVGLAVEIVLPAWGSIEGWGRWLPIAALSLVLAFCGMAYNSLVIISQGEQADPIRREWWARWSAELIMMSIIILSIVSLAQLTSNLYGSATTARSVLWLGIVVLVGSVACLVVSSMKARGSVVRVLLRAFGMLAVVGVLAAAFLFSQALQVAAGAWAWLWALGLALGGAYVVLASGPNTFSMHELYRNRLVRAFLGASETRVQVNQYVGMQAADDLPLADLRFGTKQAQPAMVLRPYPIWGAAINVTDPSALAFQERKAASFIFSPLYCGFEEHTADRRAPSAGPHQAAQAPFAAFSGYRNPLDCGVYHKRTTRTYAAEEMTLGKAMAISGAAFSSNSGATTKPERAFLLTLLGLRLGHWLPNPRDPVAWTFGSACAMLRTTPMVTWLTSMSPLRWLLTEATSRCDIVSRGVYVSDGGHFENLGAYELIRRRVKFIVVADASCDPRYGFEDLLNLQARVRTDFGVELAIDNPQALRPGANGFSSAHSCVCPIVYVRDETGAATETGVLYYYKSSVTGDEPADVLDYRARVPSFPHISTVNQWFAESAFEAYRTLGLHIGREAAQEIWTYWSVPRTRPPGSRPANAKPTAPNLG